MDTQREGKLSRASEVGPKISLNSNMTPLNGFAKRRYPAREELLDSYRDGKLITLWNLKIEYRPTSQGESEN